MMNREIKREQIWQRMKSTDISEIRSVDLRHEAERLHRQDPKLSGGVTGYREAPLKANGQIVRFDNRESAEKEARDLNQEMNGNAYRTATFRYWVEED